MGGREEKEEGTSLTRPRRWPRPPFHHRYGVPSDPQKQARVRVINRAFNSAITKLGGAKNLYKDKALQNVSSCSLPLINALAAVGARTCAG